jgi:hypothetical protein
MRKAGVRLRSGVDALRQIETCKNCHVATER